MQRTQKGAQDRRELPRRTAFPFIEYLPLASDTRSSVSSEFNSLFTGFSVRDNERQKRWDAEDRQDRRDARSTGKEKRKQKRGKKAPAPIKEQERINDAPEFRGYDSRARLVAWAIKQNETESWEKIAARCGIGHINALAADYRKLGGLEEGTLLNLGLMSLHAVAWLSRQISVRQPREQDIVRWLETVPNGASSLSDGRSKGAREMLQFLATHKLVPEGRFGTAGANAAAPIDEKAA